MKTMATASMPSSLAFCKSAATLCGSGVASTVPSARTPFIDLDHPLIKLFGQQDLLGKNVGPRLVGNAQRVTEAAGDDQQGPVAAAFQQGVCGHGRAHLDLADKRMRNGATRLDRQHLTDALNGRVAVGFGVF